MPTLSQVLEARVIKELLDFQNPLKGGGTKGVVEKVIDVVVNQTGNPYDALDFIRVRLSYVTDAIKAELVAGNVSPWVFPRLAALAFEGVFETCVAYWLLKGQPTPPTDLKQDVQDFVALQVKVFTAAIGAT
jgi:hypothetical protein